MFNNSTLFCSKMNISAIKKMIIALDKKKKIRFIFLFGSVAEQRNTPLSDVDIAIYYDDSAVERFNFRKKVSGFLPDLLDVQIFQDLPLAVQQEVIKGKVVYCDDREFMISTCIRVVREFSSFEKYYRAYLDPLLREVSA